MQKFYILTLFPNLFESFKEYSIIRQAIKKEHININIIDIRKFSNFKNKQVDDTPYGGGPGMVLMIEPIVNALKSIKTKSKKIILLSPQGEVFNQNKANKILNYNTDLIFICGHYEGIDERIYNYIDEELSIGDYILTGGEIPAMSVVDTIVRLVPGVIRKESVTNDSFSNKSKILDYPVYTKPAAFKELLVPNVLLEGNHKLINEWREYHSLKKTLIKRPDLLNDNLTNEQKKIIKTIKLQKK